MSTIHYELHRIIDLLEEDDAQNILSILKKIVKNNYKDDTILTPEEARRMEEGEAQIAKGEYMMLDEYMSERGL